MKNLIAHLKAVFTVLFDKDAAYKRGLTFMEQVEIWKLGYLANDGYPKLTEPATVGHTTFGRGVSSRHVVEAAQRAAKRRWVEEREPKTAKQLAETELARRKFWDIVHGDPTTGKQPDLFEKTPDSYDEESIMYDGFVQPTNDRLDRR